MNEIELKARVDDKEKIERTLNSFASFNKSVIRDDTYYAPASGNGKKIRLRKETENGKITWLLTYKKKEKKISTDGTSTEVNDEMETEISDPSPLVHYLEDSGFSIALTKHKEVHDWIFENATLELCNVPPLGWFLEVEILEKKNDAATVQCAQRKLKELLFKCGLAENNIEEKYYSQLLKESEKGENNHV